MTESGRAVAGAAQAGEDDSSEPTPTRWLDQPKHTVLQDVLPAFLPGLTRHQQADKWFAGEAAAERGSPARGKVAAELLRRKFELLGCPEYLDDEARVRELMQFEARTQARPAVLAACNYRAQELHDESSSADDSEDEASEVGAGFEAIGDDEDEFRPPTQTQSAVATDGGDDPADCPDCGLERRADRIGDQDLWYCPACEQLRERDVDADVGVTA